MTGTKIERGEKAQADLENLSQHSQNSFIIVRVHEGFPCLLYRRQPAPLSLHLPHSVLCSLSQSCTPSVSVPSIYHSEALSVWTSPSLLCVAFSSLFLPQPLFLYFFSLSGSLPVPTSLSLLLSFFLSFFVFVALSLCTFQDSGSVWAVGGGIDLTLCCSSHRAV